MKPYVNFLIVVLVLAALYTAYGMFTFQVDEPRPFVFSEPKMPAEFLLMDEANANTPDGKLKTLAVEEAQKALNYYRDEQKKAPQQANDTIALLIDRMTNSDLPLYFLSHPSPQKSDKRTFETLQIDVSNVVESSPKTLKQNLNCSAKSPVASVVIGTDGKDQLGCDATRDTSSLTTEPDFLFIGGPEDDMITDATGNRIVNGGTGNDTIKLGAGRTIVVLDSSWGKDTLTVDCSKAMIDPNEIPGGFSIPWVYKTTNFIVLGNSVNPKDIEWRGKVLTNKVTGDTLTVNENCFTVVPSI